MRKKGFVFHDTGGGRWLLFRILACIGTFIGVGALTLFIHSLLVAPELDSPKLLKDFKTHLRALDNLVRPTTQNNSNKVLAKLLAEKKAALDPSTTISEKSPEIRAAFFTGWDEAAFRSLEKNQGLLTHLCPEYLNFTSMEEGPVVDIDAGLDRLPESLALMPMLTNLEGSARVSEGVEFLMLASKEEKQAFISQLVEQLENVHAKGVVIDWEEVDHGSDDELATLIIEIADGLKAKGLETWLCVTMDAGFSLWDYDVLSPHVARFIALMHDENGEGDPAGPIASQDWFDGWAELVSKAGRPEQWIASLGSYGSDWMEGATLGEQISFADAMSRAGNAGHHHIKNEAPTFNGQFSYFFDGKAHEVWFLDAAAFANEWNTVRKHGFGGIILNRMGLEDAGIWDVIHSTKIISAQDLKEAILGGTAITSMGRGEVVSLDPASANGHRIFKQGEDGRIFCLYGEPSSHPTMFRMGAENPENVCITFDDGPDPYWTPALLDILKEHGVKATFFVLGSQAEQYPELIERIVAEGHEIGNHSFTHPNLAESSGPMVRLELNATQRLIESLTGRSTTLFRPPYNADSRPTHLNEMEPMHIAQSLGYLTVLENIDSRDWQTPNKEELLRRIKAAREDGNILLFHDGGGDRQATVDALPIIIEYLKERGDHIVSVGELLGIPKDKIMPIVTKEKQSMHFVASEVGFQTYHFLNRLFYAFLMVGTILVVGRTLLILLLAHTHKTPPLVIDGARPSISILIPAFNEAKVIAKTIAALLGSKYSGKMEIVVIDDGSTDETAEVVAGIKDNRVRLVQQENAGKAHALQRGVDITDSEILIFVDADTQFESDAICHLVDAFYNEKIGAVSGHARVGNLKTFLARCQDLEYVSGFNLDRRAYAAWNCITVAPGAISAIRRVAIEKAGGFSYETLAEDTDLTLAIHKAGYQIEYQPLAIAYTEAPETFGTLARQRFRWAYGTLQCVWKHRNMVFNPRFKALGWFSLPSIWFFQVILVAFSPFIDILFLMSLLLGRASDVLPYFLAFMLCDLLLAIAAVRIEGLPYRIAFRIIPLRFIYRPLLSYVIWKSILYAIRGAWVGWGKLHRTASVSIP